ncbi:FHA domain-containing protein [Pseudolysinimonas yzui]|uniref:FHA domain-containing protein n=1 Tax=Pseudolysinimonas yzui TaxID=2708254 RepID=A0A8J3GS33_9MICO|nr:FHA domain-containing protein [Pseudolysinimonas yzui]GHF21299.1 FHA domain-containing protein [Pseudolysinimonas yzui]
MSELTLLVLQLAFLLLLWGFVFFVIYSLRSDLFGQRARRMVAPAPLPLDAMPTAKPTASAPAPVTEPVVRADPAATAATPTRLVITSGPREGVEIDLPPEQLTIGRSSESGLVIRDDYTSTHHARLMLWDQNWVIQDLDSTNGTFLDGTRVTQPTAVLPGTPVTIGTTTFELRR